MHIAGLEYILQNTACRGAFMVNGDTLTPLSSVDSSVAQGAQRTRNLWASLAPLVSDAGMVIGTRGAEQSIASSRGGVIVEASRALNLGVLRAALKRQDPVAPQTAPDQAPALSEGLIALCTLADWIAAIEAPRCLRVHLGPDAWDLVAARGRFRPAGDGTPQSLVAALLAAAEAGADLALSYTDLPDPLGTCDLEPLALFGAARNATGEWHLKSNGAPISIPQTATLAGLRDMAQLARHLTDWRQGLPFELAVLRDGRTKEIVATSDAPDEIRFRTPAN